MTKKHATSRPAIVGSTHKKRSVWYRQSTAWPHRDLAAGCLEKAWKKGHRPPPVANPPAWDSLGPTNVAGRMTCGVTDPGRPDHALFGAAGGGVWHWDGSGWRDVSEGLESLNVGSLALDPARDRVYCGTGEANLSADSHPGMGLFRRKGWLSGTWGGPWELVASPEDDGIPRRIGAIAVDPDRPEHLLVAGVGHEPVSDEGRGGLYRRAGRRNKWRRVELGGVAAPYWCHDVQFHPGDPRVLFCTVTERGIRGGLWRSADRGIDWEPVGDGLPDRELWGRSRLVISRRAPDWMYLLIADLWDGVLGVYRSTNGGYDWSSISGSHFDREAQMSYNNTIAVHPDNERVVLCGGVDLHYWNGERWWQVTTSSAESGLPESIHADHHAILWPDGQHVWNANDGGVAFSEDGFSWEPRTGGLVTTMFYDLAVAGKDSTGDVLGGGTQDNGTLVSRDGPGSFQDVSGGDGGWMAFDPTNHEIYYSTIQNVVANKHSGFLPDGYRIDVTPPEEDWIRNEVWMAPLVLHASRPRDVYLGTMRVWVGRPAILQESLWWEDLSPVLDGSPITALEIAPSDPNYLYAGTRNGGLFVSQDRGSSWSGDLSSRVLPGAMITRLRAHPKKPLAVLAVVGRTGHQHVFRSQDGGRRWEPASDPDDKKRRLPDVPFRSLAVGGTRHDDVYAGSDAGLFLSRDFGDSWEDFTGKLPGAPVTDLVVHEPSGTLNVATYGRGLFRTPLAP